jgi:type II secretory pathway predicted ATPase ExeA
LKGENPFKLTPVERPGELVGYAKEKAELERSLGSEGVTLVLSDMGFGKSSLLRTLAFEGKGILIERCTKDKLYSTLKAHAGIVNNLLGRDPTDVITRPIFVDECASLTPELVSVFNNMHDRGVKLVLSLTHDEKRELEKQAAMLTLFDRVTTTILLNGLSHDEVVRLIRSRAGDTFNEKAVESVSERWRKPRDVVRICHNAWEEAANKGVAGIDEKALYISIGNDIQKQSITEREIKLAIPQVKEKEVVKGGTLSPAGEKSTEIFEYIKNHPGSMRGEIAKALSMNPNSVTNLLKILMEKGLVSRTDDFKHFAGSGPKEERD